MTCRAQFDRTPFEGGPRSAGPVEAALSRRPLRGLPGMEIRVGEVAGLRQSRDSSYSSEAQITSQRHMAALIQAGRVGSGGRRTRTLGAYRDLTEPYIAQTVLACLPRQLRTLPRPGPDLTHLFGSIENGTPPAHGCDTPSCRRSVAHRTADERMREAAPRNKGRRHTTCSPDPLTVDRTDHECLARLAVQRWPAPRRAWPAAAAGACHP